MDIINKMIIYNMENMLHIEKLLYIGTGTHIDPVLHFPLTKEFIFVDTLPRSNKDSPKVFNKKLYNIYFIDKLMQTCEENNFMLTEIIELDNKYKNKIFTLQQKIKYIFEPLKYINPTLLIFTNLLSEQTIKYYISTNIEYNINSRLILDIEESDGLIISNYSPSTKILDYFKKPKIFIGYSNMNYVINPSDIFDKMKRESIIYMMYTNKSEIISNFFYKYYLVIYRNGVKLDCKNYDEFYETYNYTKHI